MSIDLNHAIYGVVVNFTGLNLGASKKQVPIKPHTKVQGGALFF